MKDEDDKDDDIYLFIVDDLVFHYDPVGSVGSLPGQRDTVFAFSLLQDDIHCKQKDSETVSETEVQSSHVMMCIQVSALGKQRQSC